MALNVANLAVSATGLICDSSTSLHIHPQRIGSPASIRQTTVVIRKKAIIPGQPKR